MQSVGFLSWKINPQAVNNNAKDFSDLNMEEQKKFLIECLDKNLLYVPISEKDNAEYDVSDADRRLSMEFYNGNN